MTVWEQSGLRAWIDPSTGLELVVSKEGGLAREETNRVQIGMLEHNVLAGTLPFRHESRDGDVVLRYSIAGMRRLRSALRAESLREEQWEGLLAGISLALREGEDYCVRETEYVLDPDWIWVKRDVRDVKLIAVPVRGFGNPERAWRQWKALFDCFVECGLPERWRERLRPARWEKETFTHRLWMSEAGELRASEPVRGGGTNRAYEEEDAALPSDRREVPREGNSVIGQAIQEIEEGETMRFTSPRMTSREWVRLLAATVCCVVFVWKPTLPSLIVAVLGCVPLGVTLYRRYVREAESVGEPPPSPQPAVAAAYESQASGYESHVMRETAASEPLEHRTVMLSEAQETVLLSALTPSNAARLEIAFESDERVETVRLSDGPMRFGRGPAGVDVMVDHIAASRVHLEFDVADGRLRACDMGSTNGTYYLDRPMTPHERYELKDGDLLRLPGAVIRVILKE